MVGFEAGAPALVEPKCEIPPLWTCLSNRGPSSGPGTEHGGQFDWGGRLLNSNGGVKNGQYQHVYVEGINQHKWSLDDVMFLYKATGEVLRLVQG